MTNERWQIVGDEQSQQEAERVMGKVKDAATKGDPHAQAAVDELSTGHTTVKHVDKESK
jgi:hypothetical protein